MGADRIPLTSEVASSLIKSVESIDLWDEMGKIPSLDGQVDSLSEADISQARALYRQNAEMLKAIDKINNQYFPAPAPSSTSSPSWSDYASATGSALWQMSGLADDYEDAKAAGGALVSHYASPIVNGAIQVFTKPTGGLELNPVTIAFNAAEVVSSGHSVSGTASYVLGGPGAAAEAVITRYDKQMEATGNYSPITSRNYEGALAVNLVDNVATKIVGGLGSIAGAAVFVIGSVPEALGHEVLHTADEGWNYAMTGAPVDLAYNPFPDVYGYDDAAGIVHGVKSLVELGCTAPLVVAKASMVSFDRNMKDVGKALTKISEPGTSLTESVSIIRQTQDTNAQRIWDAGKDAFWERMGNADKNVLGDDPTQTPGVRLTRVGGTVGAVVVTSVAGGELLGGADMDLELDVTVDPEVMEVTEVIPASPLETEVTEVINRALHSPMGNTFPQLFEKFMGRDDVTENFTSREITEKTPKPSSERTAPGVRARPKPAPVRPPEKPVVSPTAFTTDATPGVAQAAK